jgi:hypothetical protein
VDLCEVSLRTEQSVMSISRRLLLRALSVSGVATISTPTVAAAHQLDIQGSVSWCNLYRGLLKFRPLRSDAAEHLVTLEVRNGDDVEKLRKFAHPLAPVTLRVGWSPEVDILAPWQAIEIVFANGERIPARKGRSNIS